MNWFLQFCLLGAILEVRSFPSLTVSENVEENPCIVASPEGWNELEQCDPTLCGNGTNGLQCGGPERGVCGCGSCICNNGWMGPTCDCSETDIDCWLEPPPDPVGLASNITDDFDVSTNATNITSPAPYHLLVQLEHDLDLEPQGRVRGRGRAWSSWNCDRVSAVPASIRSSMRLSYFYQKYLHAYGIPVLSSNRVPDAALRRACYVVRFLFADRRDVRDNFFDRYGRHALMSVSEQTTHIPEHSWLGASWNSRARGLGATETHPVSTGGEENVGCYGRGRDRYHEEDIFLHESAHGLHGLGARYAIPGWQARLRAAYNSARARGLWYNTYAQTTIQEYFAEGVQSFFNVESYRNPPDGIHNHVNTRDKLYRYDPTLYGLITEVFPCRNTIVDRCSNQGLIRTAPLKMNCNSDGSGGTNVGGTSGGGDGGEGEDEDSEEDNGNNGNCQDQNGHCADWARRGYCTGSYASYMRSNCRQSCELCTTGTGTSEEDGEEEEEEEAEEEEEEGSNCEDNNRNCASWARRGECRSNPTWMRQNCRRSCNVCGGTTGSGCADNHRHCRYWSQNGYCTSSSAYMNTNCPKSCGRC
ncbi:PREDICTED: uncharacterized protein LOC109477553 isoform X1 [Branchiostoma belcheri]|uniref:Uncharacterized protein LOC109477553 isoform X1 n=1 Tax=Branchiostoma belcheri TaxID=7741 RepID=A0A6P4ZU11_BRABE|nr:PREDICTED: uncharacterized protein LOC109477553 isoform X1 [Branchiostoma belcheri]